MKRTRQDMAERRIASLERWTVRIPLRTIRTGTSVNAWQITISSQCDNVIYVNGAVSLLGIDYNGATTITSVPALDPATVTSGFPSGLGKGTIVGTTTQVWVAPRTNDGTTTVTDLLQDIPANMSVTARFIVYLPVGATTVIAPVYIPWTF